MDKENLIHTIERTVAATIPQYSLPEFISRNPYHAELWQASFAGIPQDALSAVIEQLIAIPELHHFQNGWMQQGPSGGVSINLHQTADWLVAQARKNGVRETVTAFERFAISNQATAATILAVRGVTVATPLELTEVVKLYPLAALPPSIGKAFLARLLSGPHEVGASPLPPNVAALVYEDKAFGPVVTPLSGLFGPPPSGDFETQRHREETLSDVLRCLTLVGPCSPVAVGSWSQLIGPGVPMTAGGGYGYNHETAFATPVALGPFDAREARAVLKAFFELPLDTRKDLQIPLDRLNRAIRGRSLVDQAIDLGIALEAILFHGSGEQDELSFRLSLRGAWLDGGDSNRRRDRYRLLKKLYSLRSKAVHVGHLPESKANEHREVLERGFCLCASLVRRIISQETWPSSGDDWERLILDFPPV